jgi:hypothetical protein
MNRRPMPQQSEGETDNDLPHRPLPPRRAALPGNRPRGLSGWTAAVAPARAGPQVGRMFWFIRNRFVGS